MRETSRDLSALIVPQAGRVVASDDTWGPYRLVDFDGTVVESVAAYLRDLQAVRRSVTTARSYALDLLRGFRFLWLSRLAGCRGPGLLPVAAGRGQACAPALAPPRRAGGRCSVRWWAACPAVCGVGARTQRDGAAQLLRFRPRRRDRTDRPGGPAWWWLEHGSPRWSAGSAPARPGRSSRSKISRLAPSNAEIARLMESAAIIEMPLIDADGIYDPGDGNALMLLGMISTIGWVCM